MFSRNKYLMFVCMFCVNTMLSQDSHLSQSDIYVDHSNAASVGRMDSDFRFSASYRSQWNAIPDGFKTHRVSFEQKINAFSYGLDVISNGAGAASLHQNNLSLKLSYNKLLSNQSNLRIGASIGMIQQSFNPLAFQFDEQYEQGIGYNALLNNQETFDKTNQILPDFSAGLMYLTKFGMLDTELGVSMLHLNHPVASFYLAGDETYPMRTFLHLKTKYPFSEKLGLYGLAQYSTQATTKKIMIGAGVDYQIVEDKIWNVNVSTRLQDAIIFSTGLRMKNMAFGISYDLHQSKLAQATSGQGGIELSATFFFNKNKKEFEVNNKQNTAVIKDRDKDGVPDQIDQCPDIFGMAQYDGCLDKDKDGIYDPMDACPNLFGHPSNNGCPQDQVRDTDLDGLVDEVDECPFLKGLPEHKGCPDSDKDGISDKTDLCPFLKGVESNNGCPKQSIKDFGTNKNDFVPTVHVEFDTDRAEIKSSYFERLNEVVTYLVEHPEHEIFISGHTDAEGDAAYNYVLGERRSNEVVNYFLQQGISISRISIISYGETKPIHKNNNVYAKAKNRRVEITIIQ